MIRGPTRGNSPVLRSVGHDGYSGNVGRSKVGEAAIYVRRADERRFGSAYDFAGHEVPMAELNCLAEPTSKLITRAREMEK